MQSILSGRGVGGFHQPNERDESGAPHSEYVNPVRIGVCWNGVYRCHEGNGSKEHFQEVAHA